MVARIYLAGPITGLDHAGAVGWRERVRAMLGPDIRCYSPMRSKLHLADAGPLTAMGHAESVLSSPRGIMTRDHWDCAQADLIFVNLLGSYCFGSCQPLNSGHETPHLHQEVLDGRSL